MKILFELRHPAHFHHFKYTVLSLKRKGHVIKVLISEKDIIIDLLKAEKIDYCSIGKNRAGKFLKILEIISQDIKFFKECKKFKPDLVVGRPSHPLTFITWLTKKKRIVFGEDDFKTIVFNAIIAYPFTKFVLTPFATELGIFERKKIGYAGYQKLAYLHPNQFSPNPHKMNEYINRGKPFFLIRLAKLTAGHDININGIDDDIIDGIVKKLESYGDVYISSERRITERFANYKLKLPPEDIHHFLSYCNLFIGDSQSMAFEAAMLGTPSIRFNDFAGRIGVLEELEHKYGLTYGIKPSQPEKLFAKIDELLSNPYLKEEFQEKRKKMLADKIDVTAFMVWFIENYPESENIMRKNPDYQYNF